MQVLRTGGSYLEARESWVWTKLATGAVGALLLLVYNSTALRSQETSWLVPLIALLAAAFLFAAARRFVPNLVRHLYRVRKGRLGERLVTELTDRLSDDYYLINDIVLARGNIDHVVVGPCGILVLETKHVAGVIACEGDTWTKNGYAVRSYSKQVKAGAVALRELLASSRLRLKDEYIEAAVVLTNPRCRVSVRNAHVAVLRFSELLPFVTALSQRRRMQHSRANIIASVLASSSKAQ